MVKIMNDSVKAMQEVPARSCSLIVSQMSQITETLTFCLLWLLVPLPQFLSSYAGWIRIGEMGKVAIPEYLICMLCLRSSPRFFVSISKHCPLNVYKLQCITALDFC